MMFIEVILTNDKREIIDMEKIVSIEERTNGTCIHTVKSTRAEEIWVKDSYEEVIKKIEEALKCQKISYKNL